MEQENFSNHIEQRTEETISTPLFHQKKFLSIFAINLIGGALIVFVGYSLMHQKNPQPKSVPVNALQNTSQNKTKESDWKKYSNQFISFEYPPQYVIRTEKVVSEHVIQPNTKKDLYGYIGLQFKNEVTGASLDVTAVPILNLDIKAEFNFYGEEFGKNKSESGDFFKMITIDGKQASFQHLDSFEKIDSSGDGSSRLGSDKINFFAKGYGFEISQSWYDLDYNDPKSAFQADFQKILSTFHVL